MVNVNVGAKPQIAFVIAPERDVSGVANIKLRLRKPSDSFSDISSRYEIILTVSDVVDEWASFPKIRTVPESL